MIDAYTTEECFQNHVYKAVFEFLHRVGQRPQAILAGGEAYHILMNDHRYVEVTPYQVIWRGIPLIRIDLGTRDVYLIKDVMEVPALPKPGVRD